MFPAEKDGEWEPMRIRERKVQTKKTSNHTDAQSDQNGDLLEQGDGAETREETLYEEDAFTDEGAVYPMQEGRVVDWSCFYALLTHIYNTLSPPFHTPMIIITQPAWTLQDHEAVTQFFFEKFKPPALCLMDGNLLRVCYRYRHRDRRWFLKVRRDCGTRLSHQ